MDKLLALSDLATRWGYAVEHVEKRAIRDENFPPVRMRVDNGNMPLFLLKEVLLYEKQKKIETKTINIEFSKDIRLSEGIRLALEDGRQIIYNDTIYIEGIDKVYNTIKDIKYDITIYLDELLMQTVITGKTKGTHIKHHSFGNTHTFFRFKTRIKRKNNQTIYTFRFVD